MAEWRPCCFSFYRMRIVEFVGGVVALKDCWGILAHRETCEVKLSIRETDLLGILV